MRAIATGVLAATLAMGCSTERARFGTEAFLKLPPEEREVLRSEYLHAQGRRAHRLHASCVALGTVHGDLAARQFGRWAEWSRLADDDPVMTEHVLTLWRKEYSRARTARRRQPQTLEDLAAWLAARQNDVTGAWVHPEAPLWLAVGETAEALRILRWDRSLLEDVHPLIFLTIVHRKEAARSVMAATYDAASRAGLAWPVRDAAWLPWLRFITHDLIGWEPEWDREFRLVCDEHLLDAATGGYRCRDGTGMDILTTYRLAVGWNKDSDLLSWLSSPQAMTATVLTMVDTLGEHLRPQAAALLVGAMADVDSLTRRGSCVTLTRWARHAGESMAAGLHGPALLSSATLLWRVGAWDRTLSEWLAHFGCPGVFQGTVPDLTALGHRGIEAPSLADLETFVLATRRYAGGT
ncbi:hypothetical protein JXA88_02270 [Candidatus Fermentibacteria bacterium]|nr:hypothetical protein [Candidatus Fermentibacteria bacterium]